MAATFTHTPSVGFAKASNIRVINTKFGEGYSQRTSEGLNTMENSWNLSFINQPLTTAFAIDTFLATSGTGDLLAGGKDYFYFTPIGETSVYRVICQSWTFDYTSAISATITATFTRVYEM